MRSCGCVAKPERTNLFIVGDSDDQVDLFTPGGVIRWGQTGDYAGRFERDYPECRTEFILDVNYRAVPRRIVAPALTADRRKPGKRFFQKTIHIQRDGMGRTCVSTEALAGVRGDSKSEAIAREDYTAVIWQSGVRPGDIAAYLYRTQCWVLPFF